MIPAWLFHRKPCCREGTVHVYFDSLTETLRNNDMRSCPPLVMAARNGFENLISIILNSEPRPDLEEETTFEFIGHITVEGVTALWCAARAGYFQAVKLLVEAGAEVNHATGSNSTPLHVACFAGKLNVIKFLIRHGADIGILENHGHSCVMAATCGGYVDVLLYLIENGADCNQKMRCGNTALHIAAETGNMNVLTVLLECGAVPTRNEMGLTPLLVSAKCTLAHVLEYLVTRPEFSVEDKIESLEVLGAAFANDLYFYDLDKVYEYMRQSMALRFSDPSHEVPKSLAPPVPAFGGRVECRSLEELEAIRHDADALHMEALAVTQRVLGERNPRVADAVEFRGCECAEGGLFGRAAALWLHALRLRRGNRLAVARDIARFVGLFCRMLRRNMEIDFSLFYDVFSACVAELQQNKEELANTTSRRQMARRQESFQCNIMSAVHLVMVTTKLMEIFAPNEKFSVCRLIFQLNKAEVRLLNGRSLLHVSVAEDIQAYEDIAPGFAFPCAPAVRLLIECGADVNSRDKRRNTPLHVIATNSNWAVATEIMSVLLDAGAHVDAVNVFGETPLSIAKTDAALPLLQSHLPLSLKCLAARVVMDLNIPFVDEIPRALIEFVTWHGVNVEAP